MGTTLVRLLVRRLPSSFWPEAGGRIVLLLDAVLELVLPNTQARIARSRL